MTSDPVPWFDESSLGRSLLVSDSAGVAVYCDFNPLKRMRRECHVASSEVDANFRVWQTLNRVSCCSMTSCVTSTLVNCV